MNSGGSHFFSFIFICGVVGLVGACSSAPTAEKDDPAELAASTSEAVSGTACADGTPGQPFTGGMVGCPGAVTWQDRANLCSPGFHAASASEWSKWRAS